MYKIMGRKSNIDKNKLVSYDKKTNSSMCLLCERILKGNLLGNIKRHYITVHNHNFENENINYGETSSSGTNAGPIRTRRNVTYVNLNLNKSNFLKCCVGLVCVKNIPFRIFDDDMYFKKIIEPYERSFDLNLNSKNMVDQLKVCSKKIKELSANTLNKKMICLRLDAATRMGKSILVVNIEYLTDFKIFVNTIGIVLLKNIHTAVLLKEEIVKCLGDFNIDLLQIYSSTTGNVTNVVLKASKLFQQEIEELLNNKVNTRVSSITENDADNDDHTPFKPVLTVVRCVAHILQLVVDDPLRDMQTKLEECRKTVKILRTNIRSHCISGNIRMPILDNLTGWNSTYEMLQSLHHLKYFIANNDIQFPFDVDWVFIKHFWEAYQPVADFTKRLQAEQYIIGDFYRDWLVCEAELERLSGNVYAQKLVESMLKGKNTLLENDAFLAAIYLDPRFNYLDSCFLNDDQKRNAVMHILKTRVRLNLLQRDETYHILRSNNEVLALQHDPFDILEEKINAMTASTSSSIRQGNLNLRQLLYSLQYGRRMPFTTNVLEYWKSISLKQMDLVKVAEVILAVPSSQASVQRAFDALTTILMKQRSGLSSETINRLLLVKLNHNLLDLISFEDKHII